MIDIKNLENETPRVETGRTFFEDYKYTLENRGLDPFEVDKLQAINKKRKRLVTQVENAKFRKNKVCKEIACLKKDKQDASEILGQMQALSEQIKEMEKSLQLVNTELHEKLVSLPNMCHHTIPVGKSDVGNQVVRVVGTPKKWSFKAREHFEIGERLGILDFERASKVTGARFAFLMGEAALLERALIQFMMDVHSREHGYTEVIPPFVVNSRSLFGTGQFPKFQEDVFYLEGTDYYLVPTAEVPLTNLFADEVLVASDLPRKYVAYTPCFRSEAGSYGKDTRGLMRQHQFNKVELLKFVHPNGSYQELETLTQNAETILQRLELPYRVLELCTGDIGFGASKCYDLEVWLSGQEVYREISSCSIFEDFQARRANIRFKQQSQSKPQFVHTINGSGLAVGRTMIALLENYQREDGSVEIPKALHPYTNGLTEISR